METKNIVSGATEQELWPEIEAQLAGEIYEYDVTIRQGDVDIELNIDIDPGGGFEGGSEFTGLKAHVPGADAFKFALHDHNFIDDLGKFFGLEDVKTGYNDLDEHLIVKTNDQPRVNWIFADEELRAFFTGLDNFDCGIHAHHPEGRETPLFMLELNIDAGIIEPAELRKVYHAFYKLLTTIEVRLG